MVPNEEKQPHKTVIDRRIAEMLAANFDEPRFDSMMVFHMPSGGKVAALIIGDEREDVEAVHEHLQTFAQPDEKSSEPKPGGKS